MSTDQETDKDGMDGTNFPMEPVDSEVIEGYNREAHQIPQKKIAVLGTCPSRMQAPIGDITWEIWTIGPGGKNVHRWERLFEVHHEESWPEGFREYLQELRAVKPPQIIYTENPVPEWPANQLIPKDALFAKYGRMWFSSSISYALAMAIEEGLTDLGIWGIDLESGEEYRSQFSGAKYFIHLARLAGINVHMPNGCGLLRDPNPYPDSWETHLAMTLDSKIAHLGTIAAQKRAEHAQLAAEVNRIEGEIAFATFLKGLYVIHGEDPGRRAPTQAAEESLGTKIDKLMAVLPDYLPSRK